MTLVVATRNTHKLGEIRSILGAEFRYRTLQDFPAVPEIAEEGATFAENAERKARGLAEWLHARYPIEPGTGAWLVLADDSGLEVDALGGAPGVNSARFAALDSGQAGNSSDAENNAKLLRLLGDVPEPRRTARFRCVLAVVPLAPDAGVGRTHFFEGVCEGRIQFAPTGQGGFGYDPLFVPHGYACSFAELGAETKNRISHRARALAQLRASGLLGRPVTG